MVWGKGGGDKGKDGVEEGGVERKERMVWRKGGGERNGWCGGRGVERKERMVWGKGGGERKGWCGGRGGGKKGKVVWGEVEGWYVVKERVDIMWVERKDKERWGGEGNGKGGCSIN